MSIDKAAQQRFRPGSKMGRQLGIRWAEDRRTEFDKLAGFLRLDSAELARQALEEFLSCFLTLEEHEALGMQRYWGHHGMLEFALREARKQSISDNSDSRVR
jgi:plasmid stabilization system protein ParE